MRKENTDTFDWTSHIAELGDRPALTDPWEQELVAAIIRHVPKTENPRILEIGCSNGRWLNWFKDEYGGEAHGVDNNPAGSAFVPNFHLSDARQLPFSDGWFDIVFSFGLVEHFPTRTERLRLVREHARVTKPGTGIVIILIPNLDISLDRYYIKLYYDWRRGYKHYVVTARELKRAFRESGLIDVAFQWNGWIVPSLARILLGHLKKYLPRPAVAIETLCERRLKRRLPPTRWTAQNILLISRKSAGGDEM
ncbi:MAG: class I SAM-dependent methyltransferase [Spirochaetales bacterium]|nr:class I SAM-dependent methyltransferase [Spirochaetales bacterium]